MKKKLEFKSLNTQIDELESANKRLRAEYTNQFSSVCIYSASKEGNPVVFATPAFSALTGYPSDQIIGLNAEQSFSKQCIDIQDTMKFVEAMKNGGDVSLTLKSCRADNTIFWNQINISSVKNTQGIPVYFVTRQSELKDPNEAESSSSHSGSCRGNNSPDQSNGGDTWGSGSTDSGNNEESVYGNDYQT